MSDIQHTFAANLRRYRQQANLTQEELAEKSGVHRTYVGGIEQERINVSINNVERLARALKISPALLFVEYKEEFEIINEKQPDHTNANESNLLRPIESNSPDENSEIKSNHKKSRSPASTGSSVTYYLASSVDEHFSLTKLQDVEPNLTVTILCELIAQDPNEETLLSRFKETQKIVLNFLRKKQ